MAGELNGTDVKLAVEAVPAGGSYNDIGGLLSNSFTANNSAIDLTNKSSGGFRELMAGEGLQSVDISAEIIFSTEANFAIMKAGYLSQALLLYQIARGAEVIGGAFKIISWAEASPDQDKVVVSVSLQSSGAITGI